MRVKEKIDGRPGRPCTTGEETEEGQQIQGIEKERRENNFQMNVKARAHVRRVTEILPMGDTLVLNPTF